MNHHLFGTDGIRRTVGQHPLTVHDLPLLGHALGRWLIDMHGENAHLLIAHDTRTSSSFIKAALETGLLLHPIIINDAAVLPTPTVCRIIKQKNKFKAGIIITASHNPYQDNGIKIVDKNGNKIDKNQEMRIEQYFKNSSTIKNYKNFGNMQPFKHAEDSYINDMRTLCSLFSASFLEGITIVLDCANGATSYLAPRIFKLLGATIISIHNKPNGTNINKQCGTQDVHDLIDTVRTNRADIGFAFDGDGDRLTIITKDGIIKNGDDILFFLLNHPRFCKSKKLVGTIISNQGLEDKLVHCNKKLIRTAVGESAIVEQLKYNNLTLGGEPSGHIIMFDYLGSSDALFTALCLLEVIIHTDNWAIRTFDHYPQINLAIPVSTKKQPLDKPPLAKIIKTAHKALPKGRLIIRYSGTENLLRITAEDQDKLKAQRVVQNLAKIFRQKLSKKENVK